MAQTTMSTPDELTGTKALREGKEILVRVRVRRFDHVLMDWKR